MRKPILTLLTDFGHTDPYVGIMKGVILGICPEAQIVDLTHEVIPYRIAQGAFLLEQAWRWFPKGTVHVVVVDPGVGTARRPILVEAGGQFFIGPDNGVFSMLPEGRVREIRVGATASQTFHGRDVFAPAAAQLAAGVTPAKLGKLITDPVRLSFHHPARTGEVLHIDRFGNVITNFRGDAFPKLRKMRVGSETVTRRVTTFAEVPAGELAMLVGSSGYLEIVLNQASAAERLGVGVGAVVDAVEA